MSKNNNKILTQTLLSEGKVIKREVIDNKCIITVVAFNHTYRIEAPYTNKCKIIQER